ncbi:MAG: hypothetical protein R3E12_01255 [Candidatus Eisenbacteria bacterium]
MEEVPFPEQDREVLVHGIEHALLRPGEDVEEAGNLDRGQPGQEAGFPDSELEELLSQRLSPSSGSEENLTVEKRPFFEKSQGDAVGPSSRASANRSARRSEASTRTRLLGMGLVSAQSAPE